MQSFDFCSCTIWNERERPAKKKQSKCVLSSLYLAQFLTSIGHNRKGNNPPHGPPFRQIKNKAPLASIGSQTPSSVSFFRSTALLAIMQFQLQLNWNNIFLFRFRSGACDISFCSPLSVLRRTIPHCNNLFSCSFCPQGLRNAAGLFVCTLSLSHSLSRLFFFSLLLTLAEIYYLHITHPPGWRMHLHGFQCLFPFYREYRTHTDRHTVTQAHIHSYQKSISARNARTKKTAKKTRRNC